MRVNTTVFIASESKIWSVYYIHRPKVKRMMRCRDRPYGHNDIEISQSVWNCEWALRFVVDRSSTVNIHSFYTDLIYFSLKPVHTGDYSRRFRRQRQLSPKTATVTEFVRRQSPFSATVWTGLWERSAWRVKDLHRHFFLPFWQLQQ